MQQLVELSLHTTERDANFKQKIGDGLQAGMRVKEIIDRAVQASPEAAIAWVSVCFALEVCVTATTRTAHCLCAIQTLTNPSTEASSDRRGISYVVLRMDWYESLSGLLLDENLAEPRLQEPRHKLEDTVTQRYATLLLYQMESVCYHHQSRGKTTSRSINKKKPQRFLTLARAERAGSASQSMLRPRRSFLKVTASICIQNLASMTGLLFSIHNAKDSVLIVISQVREAWSKWKRVDYGNIQSAPTPLLLMH
jgi:hypothetical protein